MVKKHESLIVLQTGGSADGRLPIAFCGYGYFEMELNRIQHSAVDLFCISGGKMPRLPTTCISSPSAVLPSPP